MNRHDRRANTRHLRSARAAEVTAPTNGNGAHESPSPEQAALAEVLEPRSPPPFMWCIHELRETPPRFAIGTRVIYRGPFPPMHGGSAIIVAAAQRVCRLLGLEDWRKACIGNDKAPPIPHELLESIHDHPAYYLDHLETKDGQTRAHDQRLAIPIWTAEAWLEEVPRIVLSS